MYQSRSVVAAGREKVWVGFNVGAVCQGFASHADSELLKGWKAGLAASTALKSRLTGCIQWVDATPVEITSPMQ